MIQFKLDTSCPDRWRSLSEGCLGLFPLPLASL